MTTYPIIAHSDHAALATADRPLPVDPVQDFSVLGFRVDDCQRAATILEDHAFALQRTPLGLQLCLDHHSHCPQVIRLLRGHGVACDMADVVQGIYQG